MGATPSSLRVLSVTVLLAALVLQVRTLSSAPLTGGLYPPHTSITYLLTVSNGEMDCDWGFRCPSGGPETGLPVFHGHTQDALHRLSGWAQFGDTRVRGGRMMFALYASRYASSKVEIVSWNVQAFADFRMTLMISMYRDVDPVPRLIPPGRIGVSSEQLIRTKKQDALAMACWTESIEVEGVVIYPHGSNETSNRALQYLTGQVHAAAERMSAT